MSRGNWGKRRLNALSIRRNPLGEYCLFGRVGSGKDSVVVTLGVRKSWKAIGNLMGRYRYYVDQPMSQVPRNLK